MDTVFLADCKRLEQSLKVKYNFLMKSIILGALAHVDAGKTTLSESLLYLSHQIRKRGRVDHQDTVLDYDRQERSRGITIFLKQARFPWKETEFTLLDTPGHIDFSAEMERTLQVLDYAVVLISGFCVCQQDGYRLYGRRCVHAHVAEAAGSADSGFYPCGRTDGKHRDAAG